VTSSWTARPHDHQSLLSPERQLALLDGYAYTDASQRGLRDLTANFRLAGRNMRRSAPRVAANRRSTCAPSDYRNYLGNIAAEEEEMATRYRLASNGKRLPS
jgi:DNA repair ATPase RecN